MCKPYIYLNVHLFIILFYLFTQGRGGGVELNQREGERGNSSLSWVENINMTDFAVSFFNFFYEMTAMSQNDPGSKRS
jgi:hypothetical protein